MPQIDQMFEIWSSQLFWLAVIFGLVFFVVGKGMVPKVTSTVDARDTQIASDLAAAKAARDAADEQEEAWRSRENANRESAQAIVGEAKARAQAATEARLAEAQGGIDARLAEAEARIAASRDAAAAEIETVAVDAAQDIVRQFAHVSVDEAAARAAVQEAMTRGQ